jgi:hypothetical protein
MRRRRDAAGCGAANFPTCHVGRILVDGLPTPGGAIPGGITMNRFAFLPTIAILLLPVVARAQTDPRILTTPWPTAETWGETHDDMLYQAQADMKGEHGANAQIFWWDSTGRFRLHPSDPNSPAVGYRYLTINFDTNSHVLPDTFDEVSLAGALHVGELAGGGLSLVFGAGYSGDNPFADSEGVFGIAHLLWQKRLSDTDTLVLSVDHNGVAALHPDVPLPGVEYFRRDGPLWLELGFPRDAVIWSPPDSALSFEAAYEVPYTADVTVDYKLGRTVSVFARYANFYNAFRLDGEPQTDRMFFQMSRAEIGVRVVEPHLVFDWAYVDASLSIGYAFEQHVAGGFDVRETHPLDEVSDVPYVGFVLRGRF